MISIKRRSIKGGFYLDDRLCFVVSRRGNIKESRRERNVIIKVFDDKRALGEAASAQAEATIRRAIAERPIAPASILRRHDNATVYLDTPSAALLSRELLARANLQ